MSCDEGVTNSGLLHLDSVIGGADIIVWDLLNAEARKFLGQGLTVSGHNIKKMRSVQKSENTQLVLQRGKHHCTANLLFNWFEFNQTNKFVDNFSHIIAQYH